MGAKVDELLALVREGGDFVSYLLVYMAYKQHHNSQVIERQERRITILETVLNHCPLVKPTAPPGA